MKSILFSILLALSFTTALAEKKVDASTDAGPVFVNVFKQPESSILPNESLNSGMECILRCSAKYRSCLINGNNSGYYCDYQLEACSSACI